MSKFTSMTSVCPSAEFCYRSFQTHSAQQRTAGHLVSREESGNRENTAAAMRMERDKNHRSGSVPQPYPPVCGDTAENLSVALYGVSEREKQHNAV